jgi:5'(3')-deoxyribonucleotidase
MYHTGSVITREKLFIVAFDCDLTLLETLTPWLNFFGLSLDEVPRAEPGVVSDLSPWIRKNRRKNFEIEPTDWWKMPGVYKNAQPLPGVFHFIQDLQEMLEKETSKEVRFVVVSSCHPEHINEKWMRIEELFPMMFDAKIPTSSKHYVDFDLLFDDSLGVLQNCVDSGKHIVVHETGLSKINPQIENWSYIYNPTRYPKTFEYSTSIINELRSKLKILGWI